MRLEEVNNLWEQHLNDNRFILEFLDSDEVTSIVSKTEITFYNKKLGLITASYQREKVYVTRRLLPQVSLTTQPVEKVFDYHKELSRLFETFFDKLEK